MRAAKAAGDVFVSKLALTPESAQRVESNIINESYTCRRDKDGNYVQSTMWKTKLSSYWISNNKEEIDMNVMHTIKNTPELYHKVLAQLRSDLSSLGYEVVILKAFEYTERSGRKVLDYNVLVPCGH